jgi:hypothetical protein
MHRRAQGGAEQIPHRHDLAVKIDRLRLKP